MKTTWKTRTAVAFTAAGVLTVGWATTVQAAPTPSPVPTPAATTATADATWSVPEKVDSCLGCEFKYVSVA